MLAYIFQDLRIFLSTYAENILVGILRLQSNVHAFQFDKTNVTKN